MIHPDAGPLSSEPEFGRWINVGGGEDYLQWPSDIYRSFGEDYLQWSSDMYESFGERDDDEDYEDYYDGWGEDEWMYL